MACFSGGSAELNTAPTRTVPAAPEPPGVAPGTTVIEIPTAPRRAHLVMLAAEQREG